MGKKSTPHAGPQGTARRGDEPANRKGAKPAKAVIAIQKRNEELTPVTRTRLTEKQHGRRASTSKKK